MNTLYWAIATPAQRQPPRLGHSMSLLLGRLGLSLLRSSDSRRACVKGPDVGHHRHPTGKLRSSLKL